MPHNIGGFWNMSITGMDAWFRRHGCKAFTDHSRAQVVNVKNAIDALLLDEYQFIKTQQALD